uniref:CSON006708 protein n=1 Tax=Culicoides sonorensis TaxID=179676 RepID=A0A336LKC0_CULSO
MVLTNCNTEFLPLDSETATQTTFYKNEHHHNHINALHRQNATFNLLDSHTINHLSNNNSVNFGTVSNMDKGQAPILSSNGYYGYVNNFSAVTITNTNPDATHFYKNQQAENCTDSDMCVDEEVNGAAGILPFQSVCVVVDKRKRLDEGLDGYYEPAKRRRFIHENPCEGIGNTDMMQTENQNIKSFEIQHNLAPKNNEPSSQLHYGMHRDSNRCMMSHFI